MHYYLLQKTEYVLLLGTLGKEFQWLLVNSKERTPWNAKMIGFQKRHISGTFIQNPPEWLHHSPKSSNCGNILILKNV